MCLNFFFIYICMKSDLIPIFKLNYLYELKTKINDIKTTSSIVNSQKLFTFLLFILVGHDLNNQVSDWDMN